MMRYTSGASQAISRCRPLDYQNFVIENRRNYHAISDSRGPIEYLSAFAAPQGRRPVTVAKSASHHQMPVRCHYRVWLLRLKNSRTSEKQRVACKARR